MVVLLQMKRRSLFKKIITGIITLKWDLKDILDTGV